MWKTLVEDLSESDIIIAVFLRPPLRWLRRSAFLADLLDISRKIAIIALNTS